MGTNYDTLFLLFLIFFTGNFLKAQGPCDSDAHRQFDFWVGDWAVYHATADTLLGHNQVKNILNGCVIEENWTSAGGGFQGKSLNTYSASDSTWNQVWVDVGGNTYYFSGTYQDQVMQMFGKTVNGEQEIRFDMAYHFDPNAGTIRQVWKMSRDDGGNWQTIFDGIYRKK